MLVLISTGPVQRLGQPWLASWSGTPSPIWGWWTPVAQLYKVEVGLEAQYTRFVAATVPHRPNPSPIEREELTATGSFHQRRPLHCDIAASSSLRHVSATMSSSTWTGGPMATPASHHDTSTPPVAACALPSSTNAVTPWKQEGIPLGKVRHPLDLPLLDPKYSNKKALCKEKDKL